MSLLNMQKEALQNANQMGTLYALNLNTNKTESKFNLDSGAGPILSCNFNHNGKMIVTAGADGYIRVFDIGLPSPIMTWKAHEGCATSAYFSSDENTIFTTGMDGLVCQWAAHKLGKLDSKLKIPYHSQNSTNRPQIVPHTLDSDYLVLNDPATVWSVSAGKFQVVNHFMTMSSNKEGMIRMQSIDMSPTDPWICGSGLFSTQLYIYTIDKQKQQQVAS